MAAPKLKHYIDRELIDRLGRRFAAVVEGFDRDRLITSLFPALGSLELKDRVGAVARGLAAQLHEDFPVAVAAVVDRAAWYLGVGLANCVDIFDPDVLVIGGGLVEKLGDDYLEKVRKSTVENAMVPVEIPIVAASLGDESVVVGAAALASAEADNG